MRKIVASAFGLALIGCLVPSVSAAAAPSPAKIVFGNGGRIFSANADGSDRQYLFGPTIHVRNTTTGATEPRFSPDGSRLAVVLESTDERSGSDILVANADGSHAVLVADGDAANLYSDPTWSPDGKKLLVSHTKVDGNTFTAGLATVDPEGSLGKSDVYRSAPRTLSKKGDKVTTFYRPRFSPDGKAVLFVSTGWDATDDPENSPGRLYVLNVASGDLRLISTRSFGGSWSPDGTRIVHSAVIDDSGKVCSAFACSRGGRLFITSLDGRVEDRVIAPAGSYEGSNGDERNPDWSGDGSRIVFQSERNLPGEADAYEIYSVEPDGGCLTWLTNGAPASLTPSWVAADDQVTDPGSCGDRGARPLLEIPPPVNTATATFRARYWLGPEIEGHQFSGRHDILSSEVDGAPYTAIDYHDCARFLRRECGEPVSYSEFSVCRLQGGLATNFLPNSAIFRRRRGVPMSIGFPRYDRVRALAITDSRALFVAWDRGDRLLDRDQVVSALQPIKGSMKSKKFPAARFPSSDIRKMRNVVKVAKHSGTIEKAASRLDLDAKLVKANLRMNRKLKVFRPIRTLDCPK